MSDDLIKRENVLSIIEKMYERCTTDSLADYRALMLEAVKVLPYADRPQGEWIDRSDGGRILNPWWETYECSRCGQYGTRIWNFCPNCGCRMKGVDDECNQG